MASAQRGQDSLRLLDFGVLLQALSNNLKVGVLAVRSGDREKFLHLDRTNLRCVYTGRPRVSLQKVLFNHRSVTRDQLRAAAEALGENRTDDELAHWMLANSHVTLEQLRRGTQYQLVEEVLELFYWKNVGFEFFSGDDDDLTRRISDRELAKAGSAMATEGVLLQCTKIIDDIAKFNEVTPSLRDVYELQFDSIAQLEAAVPDPAQREFMLLIDGLRDMRQILADMRMNRFDVLELFHRFRIAERIRPKNAFELLMLAENRRAEFSAEKRARVLERVNELGVEGFGVVLPLAQCYEKLGQSARAAESYAKHARMSVAAANFEVAAESAQKAVDLLPGDCEIRRLNIELLLHEGSEAKAAEEYKVLAEILSRTGDGAGTRDALERACKLAPNDPIVRRRLGETLFESSQHKLAATRVRQAGDLFMAAGSPSEAADCYRRVLRLWPRTWTTRHRLARAMHDSGRSDLAVQALSDLVRFVSDDLAHLGNEFRATELARVEAMLRDLGGLVSSAGRQLGDAYKELGREDDAVRVLFESAEALVSANRHRTAEELYGDLVDLRPRDVKARSGWARCHAAMGDRDLALTQFRRVADAMTKSDDWASARSIFDEMLAIDEGCLEAHTGLALALLHIGDGSASSEHFHRAGLLHRGRGRAQDALPFFHEAVTMQPNDVRLLDEYCELLLAVGVDTAVTLSALNSLVELRMQREEHALAAIALTRILDIDACFPGAKEILVEAAKQLRRIAEESEDIDAAAAAAIIADARERDFEPVVRPGPLPPA